MRFGFLFNHYTAHQILHALPIAFELSRRYPQATVETIVTDDESERLVRRLAGRYPGHRCGFVRAAVPRSVQWIDPIVRQVAFVRKPAVLRANLDLFARLDVLVVPETTSLELKAIPQCRHLRFVRVSHGSGDREKGFSSSLGRFDLVLVSGRKTRDRLVREGTVDASRCRIVGYPKFELAGSLGGQPPAFPGDRPTVLYNPHFDRKLSSWVPMGRSVLEFFRRTGDYNLIFAPHVILFQRGLRHGARPLGRFRRAPNIHVDTGSLRSIDMSYTNAADIYLGDVSSQVYEFLQTPRPCVFLNGHQVAGWEEDENYRSWTAGEVIEDVATLESALARARERHRHYVGVQERLFAETFDIGALPPSIRAADAIAGFFGLEDRVFGRRPDEERAVREARWAPPEAS